MNVDAHITRTITAVLETAIAKEFQLPFHLALVGSNGSFVYSRYTAAAEGEALNAEPLASQTIEGMLTFPMNVMVVDREGRAFGARIKAPGTEPEIWRN
jgi:hypothetical protein